MYELMSADEAIRLIRDGDCICVNSFVGIESPVELHEAIYRRYQRMQSPTHLTIISSAGFGVWDEERNAEGYIREGAVDRLICGHFGAMLSTKKLVLEDRFEAYNLPLGCISHAIRAQAGGIPGALSKVGLDIFVDPTHRLNLPVYVNAWDVRANLNQGAWGLLAEYAQKTQDPSFDNSYSYANGHVAMLSGSYSKKGLSILLQAKRSENMSFRSQRSRLGTSMFINHLPAFTLDHTYALAALYPYATQLAAGEWAYQGEVGYNFKRKTVLGGKYGMNVKLNYSYVRAIQNAWLKWGDATYYQDLNIQLTRRLTSDVKLNLMYMNQRYNKTVVEGEGGMIHSNIFVADAMFQLARTTKLRTELQYLSTRQDQKDWAFALAELSLAPHWMITASDLWNHGDTKTHYYQGQVTYNLDSHRIQLGYGRTRAGYNCSGGVCRFVPATRGFTLSYNYNF